MDAAYELGRYKKKVEDQQKEISELKAEAEGYQELLKANDALVAAVVKACGEVEVTQADINDALRDELGVMTSYDVEARTYTLRTAVKTDGGEETCEQG